MNKNFESREFAEAWDKNLREKDDVLRTRLMNQILVNNIGSLKNKIVLDAGCGNGFFLGEIQNLNPKEIYAFDISKYLIEITKKNFPEVKFKVADLMKKLPYENDFFDEIICYNVVMDIPEVKNAFNEFNRILAKNGFLHLVIVHPLFNAFVNDKNANSFSEFEKLKNYMTEGSLKVSTIPNYDEFVVYRRPISYYVNNIVNANLAIEEMLEVSISEEIAKLVPKHANKIGTPVFAYFKLRKSH